MNSRVIQMLILVMLSSCQESNIKSVHYLNTFDDDFLGVRFFMDTITIKKPVLAIYKDALYVMPEKFSHEFVSDPACHEESKVFYILPHNIREDIMSNTPVNESEFSSRAEGQLSMGRSLYSTSHFSTIFDKRIGEVEFYLFDPLPSKFLLELVWYDPGQYINNPYGKNYVALVSDNPDSSFYKTKLDSLESVPVEPMLEDVPHYILTVEPLYDRETVNNYITKKESIENISPSKKKAILYPKWYAHRFCFPDL